MTETPTPTPFPPTPLAALLCALILALGSCGGGKPGDRQAESSASGARAALLGIEYGRLVDLYAWRRNDPDVAERADARARTPQLVARDVLVHPYVRSEDPYVNASARYRYLPYDPKVGHRQLLILWDDELEAAEFESARESAQAGLPVLAAHFAFARGLPSPAPIVPRDATLRLRFDRSLGLEQEYFDATPGLVQVLRLAADPAEVGPELAYETLDVHVLVQDGGKSLLVDLEVSGDEATDFRASPNGLPASLDEDSANIRLAMPLEGRRAKRFRVRKDERDVFNQVDATGSRALIRDFRSGNRRDADAGALPDVEAPRLVARARMKILAIDEDERVLTIDKLGQDLVLRGRVPFVDGPYATLDGRPLGPNHTPQRRRIERGDVVWQDVVLGSGETVRVAAEVLENLDIASREADEDVGVGGGGGTARVRVQQLHARSASGALARFRIDAECTAVVHYTHAIELGGGSTVDVGDAARLASFVSFVPDAAQTADSVEPEAGVRVYFSQGMDLDSVRTDENFVLANPLGTTREILRDRKAASLSIVPSRAFDATFDATSVQLSTPLGLFHREGDAERYWLHILAGDDAPRARAGEPLDLGAPANRVDGVSLPFTLRRGAPSNLVASFLARMEHPDENGTSEASSSPDYFGQYQIRDGRLYGLSAQRFSRVFDMNTSPNIRNELSARCAPGPAPLYPVARDGTGVVEPFVTEGSRLQQTYREVDFNLSYRDASEMELDVEALHWAPLVTRTPSKITFDRFDRVSMTMSHAEKRPDVRVLPDCSQELGTNRSGLGVDFEGNYLDGAPRVEVVKDAAYVIDPNNAFAAATGTTFISYPAFRESFTWRDRRAMSITADGRVTGLGGSQNPNAASGLDRTRDVTSPHIPEIEPDITGTNARQDDDYKGDQRQDLAPFALPLLIDFSVWPDDAANGSAKADNVFQIARISGFYNFNAPNTRVQSTGGFDGQRNLNLVDPPNTPRATGGWLFNGSFRAPVGDSHVPWAQADFVRKVSVVTSGYFDTLAPRRNAIQGPPSWTGTERGFPDLLPLQNGELRAAEFALFVDPVPERQALGTKVVIEWRGSTRFDNGDAVYAYQDDETASSRNNLLNPDFACEQYRYMASGRVSSEGVTPYVGDVDELLDPKTGRAPRFLNYRITLTNNTEVPQARVPFVSSIAIAWRVR